MPFKSQKQRAVCYAMKAKGKAGSWDCSKWEAETKAKKLPQTVKKKKK